MGDLVKVFFEHIKELDGQDYLNTYLRYQLSPMIHGVKPAITININKSKPIGAHWDLYGTEIVQQLEFEYVTLRETENVKIVMIYDRSLIQQLLEQEEIKIFLRGLGYPSADVTESMTYLVERYSLYHCPHELGVFLGIPLHDVEVFMDCTERKCLLCGYWKVYSHLDYATQQFKKYDDAKEAMLKTLISELKGA